MLLLGLLVLAGEFGLDVVLGAFLAGAVLRRWAPGDVHALESKLDAVGYGFFIPIFFVSAGMAIDIDSIGESPARLAVFVVLLFSPCEAYPPRAAAKVVVPAGRARAGVGGPTSIRSAR